MSKCNSANLLCMNSTREGLLCVPEERLSTLIKKEPITEEYHVEHAPFARGKFAVVRRVTNLKTGVAFAAKFIRKRRRAVDQRLGIMHEAAVLVSAEGCDRIVKLHEVYETPSEMVLVLELASGGDLQYVIDAGGESSEEGDGGIGGITEAHTRRILRQVIEGIAFLHDHNIAHLDIKPQNILLCGPYPGADIKLCDFGISRVVELGAEVREILGTPDYVAPEVLSYEPISLATDIWSIGVLSYVLLSGCSPFGSDCKQETFCNISRCNLSFPEDLFDGVSEAALDFIKATIVAKPRGRLTARQCLEHPWLAPEIPLPTTSPSALFAVLVSHSPSTPTADVSSSFEDPSCPAKCAENHCKCSGHESYAEGLSSTLKSPMEVMCDRGIRC